MNCVVCGTEMTVVPGEEQKINHPSCPLFAEPFDENPEARQLRDELLTIILDTAHNEPRSLQKELGPSDLGTPCDRRLVYKLTDTPIVNYGDPWAATVGSSVHSWLQKAFEQREGWITEQRLWIGEFIVGTADLYRGGMVIDHKTVGTDVMKQIRKEGPPPEHVTQVQLYGYGYRLSGVPVDRVALAFYPRSGFIHNMYTWVGKYDESIALAALNRIYYLANKIFDLDLENNPARFSEVSAVPHKCGFCPFYRPDMEPGEGATNLGCPGK